MNIMGQSKNSRGTHVIYLDNCQQRVKGNPVCVYVGGGVGRVEGDEFKAWPCSTKYHFHK